VRHVGLLEWVGGLLIVITLAFTMFAYAKAKTDRRWCAWFGGIAVPSFCRPPPTTPMHCVQWSE
jgi:hypothetical protein